MNDQIKKTLNYEKFSFINGNREINNLQVTRLTKSIKTKHIEIPIIVNERLDIIDGQHRYCALKSLRLPSTYIKKEGLGLIDVTTLNTNTKNWGHIDFMHSYANNGLKDYILYREFKNKYNFGHTVNLALLTGGENKIEAFKEGAFKIKSITTAMINADKINEVQNYYKGYKRRAFIRALLKLFKNPDYKHDEFIKKLRYKSISLVDCTSEQEYLKVIEHIYNYNRKNKVRLFTYA